MKTNHKKHLVLGGILFAAITSLAWGAESLATDSCEIPGRNTNLCYKMKNIKSMLNLLEGQEYLMQVNYNYIETISKNMLQVIERILVQMGDNSHLVPLNQVRTQVEGVLSRAKSQDLDVYRNINEIQEKCLACHSSNVPASGIEWEKMSMISWDRITQRCHTLGRNPVVCKNMHALSTNLAFLDSVEFAQVRNYASAESAANEILRVIDLLSNLQASSLPEGLHALDEIKPSVQEVIQFARQSDARAFGAVEKVKSNCVKCHAVQFGNH